ncbi:MAG: bifunctional indole-3-glycerol-phosphate synthase TrpC/phosphoribosylanthranilate isomerase TrpF [bacterium]
MNILNEIIEYKKQEIAKAKKKRSLSCFINDLKPSGRNFKKAISKEGINLIAELKKTSPSVGVISKNFDINKIIKIYNKYASAISILTDKNFFSGSLKNLKKAGTLSKLPLLRKDFIIDEYQIYEARDAGADAILLIASVLSKEQINNFIKIAKKYEMDCLTEVHNIKELKKVLKTDAEIIGINNRNLEDFKININTTVELAKYIPPNKIVVSESGINDYGDIINFDGLVDAVLVGTSLLKSENIEYAVKNLLFPQVKICGIKKLEHAKIAVKSGADFLGFIFVEGRRRYIDPKEAKIIIQKIRKNFPTIKIVGIFQNEKLNKINEIAYSLKLDFIQLHGNEDNNYCQNAIRPVIKSINVENSKSQIIKNLNKYDKNIASFLLDALDGGRGKKFDWNLARDLSKKYPIVLSGGLNLKNVEHAIKIVQPHVVDVSSGVEGGDGGKDSGKIKEFIEIVKS